MTNVFSLFPKLPPEIRHQIWRLAFEDNWAFAVLRRDGRRRLKFLGAGSQSVRQTCHEARHVMRLTHTHIKGLGWVDFARLLIYFKDEKADRRLMQRSDISQEILPRIKHLVLNAITWKRLMDTMERVKRCCTSLQTIIVIAAWTDPPPPAIYNYNSMFTVEEGLEGMPLLFSDTPAEVNMMPLVEAVSQGDATNSEFYLSKLNGVFEIIPPMDPLDHAWGWLRRRVGKVERAFSEFPNPKPVLCLVRKDELDPRKAFVSWDNKDHKWISHIYWDQRET